MNFQPTCSPFDCQCSNTGRVRNPNASYIRIVWPLCTPPFAAWLRATPVRICATALRHPALYPLGLCAPYTLHTCDMLRALSAHALTHVVSRSLPLFHSIRLLLARAPVLPYFRACPQACLLLGNGLPQAAVH